MTDIDIQRLLSISKKIEDGRVNPGHAKYLRAYLIERAKPTSEDKQKALEDLKLVYSRDSVDGVPIYDAYKRVIEFINRALLSSPPEWNYNLDEAPMDGTDILGFVDDTRTIITWGKVSHVPIYGWIDLTAGGPMDRDLCSPIAWQFLSNAPKVQE